MLKYVGRECSEKRRWYSVGVISRKRLLLVKCFQICWWVDEGMTELVQETWRRFADPSGWNGFCGLLVHLRCQGKAKKSVSFDHVDSD
jgi:hypothetical protein